MPETQGWADLPEVLLHSIVARLGLGSAPDLLAFAATCHSWDAALSSSLTTFPPLLLQPDTPCANNLVPRHPYLVTDIAKVNHGSNPCSEIPLYLDWFSFMGASYGHLILSNRMSCIVIDLFRGISVSPPPLPVNKPTEIIYGALTAPLTSRNSHLIVDSALHNLFWRVGSNSWVKCSTRYGTIKQIVVFKGRVFGMDSARRIFKVHLTPEISIHELPLMECSMINRKLTNAWLVACGDMLLLVGFRGPLVVSGVTFEVFRLDLSFEPALWLKVDKLENWAIFISTDKRSQTLSCNNPEIWGGRSNCVYCYNHEAKRWTALELGNPVQASLFTWAATARCNPCGLSPAFSLCVGIGFHFAWLIYLIYSRIYCNGF